MRRDSNTSVARMAVDVKRYPFSGPLQFCGDKLRLRHGITAGRLAELVSLAEAVDISGLTERVLCRGVAKGRMRGSEDAGGEVRINVFDAIFFRPPGKSPEEMDVYHQGVVVAEYGCARCGTVREMRCTRRVDLERARG